MVILSAFEPDFPSAALGICRYDESEPESEKLSSIKIIILDLNRCLFHPPKNPLPSPSKLKEWDFH